jgi:proteic killer suppression protein
VIRSFRCGETKAVFELAGSRKFKAIEKPALGRLLRLNAATSLQDLAAIRGNRLEALAGNRKGQHSIRINDQYRICFVWNEKEKGADEVEIVDYH